MLMELCYRLATETSPLITQIRDNVIVSITPAADPDGRDRNVDWFYQTLERQRAPGSAPAAPGSPARRARAAAGCARRGAGRSEPAVLGQVRLPRQQPRHKPVPGLDARARGLV